MPVSSLASRRATAGRLASPSAWPPGWNQRPSLRCSISSVRWPAASTTRAEPVRWPSVQVRYGGVGVVVDEVDDVSRWADGARVLEVGVVEVVDGHGQVVGRGRGAGRRRPGSRTRSCAPAYRIRHAERAAAVRRHHGRDRWGRRAR